MAKRKAAAVEPELVEDLDDAPSVALGDDDGDLWDDEEYEADDDSGVDELEETFDRALDAQGGAEGSEAEHAPPVEHTPAVAVRDEFTAFTCTTLPAKMRGRSLADQSNQWLLATIGRIVDEISAANADGRRDDEAIIDLELDLLKLFAASELRQMDATLSSTTRAFIDGVAARIAAADEPVPDEEGAPVVEDDEFPTASDGPLTISYIARELIHPDPLQPRVNVDAELRDSIRANGILQPILVRKLERRSTLAERAAPCAHCARPWREIAAAGEYVIVDGERRWLGAADVLEVIPSIVRADQRDEYDRLKTQLVANTGKPLTPIEEAHAYARMLEDRNVGIAGLARDIGRPPSSINDRLKLLELGPWLPWIEAGSVSVSMAVECLVPLRGVPDAYHTEAIAKIADGEQLGAALAETIDDFKRDIGSAYDKYMYPLAKSKAPYEKQPEFSTKNHDAECACGGIAWGGWEGPTAKGRKHCGNPDWWKPLHREALKKKREAEGESESAAPAKKAGLRLELPKGTPTISGNANSPKSTIILTDVHGHWKTSESRYGPDGAFDPADLVIDESKLLRVKDKYGYGLDRVATTDVAAVTAARAKWRARFEPARAAAAAKLLGEFVALGAETYAVKGPGVHALLTGLDDVADCEFREMAELLDIAVPKTLSTERHQRTKARSDWFAKSIARKEAERLVSFLAFMWANEKRKLPSEAIEKTQLDAVGKIATRRAPWYTSKAPKPVAAKKENAGGGQREKRPWKSVQLEIDTPPDHVDTPVR